MSIWTELKRQTTERRRKDEELNSGLQKLKTTRIERKNTEGVEESNCKMMDE